MAKNAVTLSPVTIASTAIRKDAHGRYNLNDLHKAAIAAGVATESQRPGNFLKSDGVQSFIAAYIEEDNGTAGMPALVTAMNVAPTYTTNGGKNPGTYAVELVALRYAAWMNPTFELRVYRTFQAAVTQGKDWGYARYDTRQSNLVENAIIQATRADLGKETTAVHYMSEAKMVNFAAFGAFEGCERDTLTTQQLALLSYIEVQNGVMYARGMAYNDRKARLVEMSEAWTARKALKLTNSL